MKRKKRPFTFHSIILTAVCALFLFSSCGASKNMLAAIFGADPGKPGSGRAASDDPLMVDPDEGFRLARHFQKNGRHKLAVDELRRVVRADPTHAGAFNALGVSYDRLREFDLAAEAYREALRINPNLDYVYNNIGYSNLLQGKLEAAAGAFETAVALKSETAIYQNNLALAYARLGKDPSGTATIAAAVPTAAPAPDATVVSTGTPNTAPADVSTAPSAIPGFVSSPVPALAATATTTVDTVVSTPVPTASMAGTEVAAAPKNHPIVAPVLFPITRPEAADPKSVRPADNTGPAGITVMDISAAGKIQAVAETQAIAETQAAAGTQADFETLAAVEIQAAAAAETDILTAEEITRVAADERRQPEPEAYYTIQIGVYYDLDSARRAMMEARKNGLTDPYITQVERGQGFVPYYRVRAGKFETRNQAEHLAAGIRIDAPMAPFTVMETGDPQTLHAAADTSPARHDEALMVSSRDKMPVIIQSNRDIEILNGNGVRHMARDFQQYLTARGVAVDHIGNAAHFTHPETVIYYSPGYYGRAKQLLAEIQKVEPAGRIVKSRHMDRNIRIVLGRDIMDAAEKLGQKS